MGKSPVSAAGALVWREGEAGEALILIVHRDHHGDYSLPKGKVDPGETFAETAAREVWEETGYRVTLGASLGMVDYVMPSGRPKEVHYWVCEVTPAEWQRHRFEPNNEVDAIEWLPVEDALARLTYARDRELVVAFRERLAQEHARTFPVVVLRHAKAIARAAWEGTDESRPLTSRGQREAERMATILCAFRPEQLVTSTAVRCRATLAPLAHTADITPVAEWSLSQNAGVLDGDIREVLEEALAPRVGTVICGHSPLLPEIVSVIVAITGAEVENESRTVASRAMLETGEASIFHLASTSTGLELVSSETIRPNS